MWRLGSCQLCAPYLSCCMGLLQVKGLEVEWTLGFVLAEVLPQVLADVEHHSGLAEEEHHIGMVGLEAVATEGA